MEMRSCILMVAMSLLLPVAATAGTGVTLKEAVEMALGRNHLVKAAGYDQQASAGAASASRSRYLPRVFLEENAAVTNSATRVFMMKLDEGRFTDSDFQASTLNHPGTRGDFQTRFFLEQPLLDFSIGLGVEMADREDEGRRLALARRREEVALRTAAAWFEVQKGRGRRDAAEKAVQDAGEHLRLSVVRSGTGVGLKSDELRARTFLADMEQQAVTAANDLLLARLRLAQVTGGDTGEALDAAAGGEALPPLPGKRDLVRLALENRPDLKEMEQQAGRADVAVRLARSAYLPTVYGTASYQMNDRDIPFGRDNDSWYAGAALRWELFDGLRRGKELESARARSQSAAENLEEYRRLLALEVTESWLRREEAEKRLALALSACASAEEAVRLIGRRYENSLATMADLLDAQTALNRARAQAIENECEVALATARVYHAAGVLTKEVMK